MNEPAVPPHWSLVSLLCLAGLAGGPPLAVVLEWPSAARLALLWGAAAWLVAIIIKMPLAKGLSAATASATGAAGYAVVAAAQGALSTTCELGAAAPALVRLTPADLPTILSFGLGAGCAEVVYVLAVAITGPPADPATVAAWAANARGSLVVRYSVPIERAFAIASHVGSRGLLALFLLRPSNGIALALALIGFTLSDGVAVFGHLRRWAWTEASVCRRTQGFFAAVAGVEVGCLLALARSNHML